MTTPHPPPEGEPAPDPGTAGTANEPVWTFRGYRLRSSEFTTAMVHFFRAEIARANIWRQRLDTTTNWAVVATGAAISFAFSQPSGHHGIILLNILLVTLFLVIEARRYRYYEVWSYRVRLMETDFFAAMLVPPFQPDPDWAESLAESLLHPHFSVSNWEAIGRRFRRNYLWIYIILVLAWLARNWLYPAPAASWTEVVARSAIGGIPGPMVIVIVAILVGGLFLVGILTIGLHGATGEVLPRYGVMPEEVSAQAGKKAERSQPWFRTGFRRRQLMALIITDRPQEVARRVLGEMRRGLTALPGTGMYTGKAHSVLMCALTVTEVNHLKSLVSQEDPRAFMIVSPVQEVLGGGFAPLEPDKEP